MRVHIFWKWIPVPIQVELYIVNRLSLIHLYFFSFVFKFMREKYVCYENNCQIAARGLIKYTHCSTYRMSLFSTWGRVRFCKHLMLFLLELHRGTYEYNVFTRICRNFIESVVSKYIRSHCFITYVVRFQAVSNFIRGLFTRIDVKWKQWRIWLHSWRWVSSFLLSM